MTVMDQELLNSLDQALPELIELRRICMPPRAQRWEHQTAALVAGELRSCGWRVREGVGRTGVLAEAGPLDGPTVGLRVDMDALPVEERTGLPFASTRQGVMHACGHDLHTCIGLGVARLLGARAELPYRVRLLFQPEVLAQGAVWMRCRRHRRAERPSVCMWCRICWGSGDPPRLPHGSGWGAEPDSWGRRSWSPPHQAVDAIWLAARVVTELQQAISRRLDALQPW